MANVSVYNIEGKEVETIELSDAVFGVEVNEHLVHMAVVNQLANNPSVSPLATGSPAFLCHAATVAEVTDSPKLGVRMSMQ